MRSNALILPLLACVGVALGLALTYANKQLSDVAVGPAPVRPAGQTASPVVANPAPVVDSPATANSPSGTITALEAAPTPVRQANSDPERTQPSDAPAPTHDESSATLAEVHNIPAEIAGAVDANLRAEALREIGEHSPSDSFPLLEQALRNDAIARNRLLAVNSIRLLGRRSGNAERAREALRIAMSDRDENVATSARDAYEELSR